MKRARSLAVALAVLALAPLPLMAQGGGQGGQGRGGMGGAFAVRALLDQGSVEFLVTKATDLQLDADQTAKLRAIGSKWSESTKEGRDKIRKVLPQPGQGGMGAGGDRQALMQQMQELQPVAEKLRGDDDKSLAEAMALLNDGQKEKAKALLEERAQSMRPRRGG